MSKSRSTQWRHARDELGQNDEQLDSVRGRSYLGSLISNSVHGVADVRLLCNDTDVIDSMTVSGVQ